MRPDPDSSNADRVSAHLRDRHGFVLTYRQAYTNPADPVLQLLWRRATRAVALTDEIAQQTALLAEQDDIVADLIAATQTLNSNERNRRDPPTP